MRNESVLLIYPPFKWGEKDRFCQPLGILTLATILQDAGIKVNAVDLNAEGWSLSKIRQIITKGDYTHLGITVLTPFRKIAFDIFQAAKEINPNIVTIAGGPHVTQHGENILKECLYLDYAVSGEAELKILEIITEPKQKYYELGYVKDLDVIPFPDRTHVRHIEYNELAGIYMNDSASMNWVRGCPWRKCRFCGRTGVTMAYRQRSPDKIIEEIAIIQNELKYKNIIVPDDSVRFNSKFVKNILRMKIKEGLDIPFWALSRADHIDEEGAKLMSRAGASGLLVGVESVVPRVIDMYRKASGDPRKWHEKLDKAFALGDKYNIVMIGTFMIGGPTEKLEEIQTTINYMKHAKLDIAQAFPFQFVVGSDFWHEAVAAGHIQPSQLYAYNDKQFGTTEFTTQELFNMVLEAEKEINSPLKNPGRYVRLVRKFIKQKKWTEIRVNIGRLPAILKKLLLEQPYEMVPEELHG